MKPKQESKPIKKNKLEMFSNFTRALGLFAKAKYEGNKKESK